MTTLQHSEKQRIILTHIECEPVWKGDQIELFDMYDNTTKEWLGSKRLLRYCEDYNDFYRRSVDANAIRR